MFQFSKYVPSIIQHSTTRPLYTLIEIATKAAVYHYNKRGMQYLLYVFVEQYKH